jgi:hypothetical protein
MILIPSRKSEKGRASWTATDRHSIMNNLEFGLCRRGSSVPRVLTRRLKGDVQTFDNDFATFVCPSCVCTRPTAAFVVCPSSPRPLASTPNRGICIW